MVDYNEFKTNNDKDYEIMLLREQQGLSYTAIAQLYKICPGRVRQRYERIKLRQYRIYIKYLKQVTNDDVDKKRRQILDFYSDLRAAVAYLEKIYKDKLDEFRNGEPPTVIDELPAYIELDEGQIEELIVKIAKSRDQCGKTLPQIAKELNLTYRKTNKLYQYYYIDKIEQATELIQPTVNYNFATYIYDAATMPKKRWEIIIRDFGDIVQGLL